MPPVFHCRYGFAHLTGRHLDIASAAGTTRQLNNQNYNICFRTELVSSQVWTNLYCIKKKSFNFHFHFSIFIKKKMKQKASQMCVSVCTGLVNNGDAFSITTPSNVVVSRLPRKIVSITRKWRNTLMFLQKKTIQWTHQNVFYLVVDY